MTMRPSLLFVAALVLFQACKKNRENQIDVLAIWECHKAQNLDSSDIAAKLIGTWSWNKQSCYWKGSGSPGLGVKVTFRVDHSFTVTKNASILTQGTWIIERDVNQWHLRPSSPSEWLYGYIMFCDNHVLFNDSPTDGCDNLFSRIN